MILLFQTHSCLSPSFVATRLRSTSFRGHWKSRSNKNGCEELSSQPRCQVSSTFELLTRLAAIEFAFVPFHATKASLVLSRRMHQDQPAKYPRYSGQADCVSRRTGPYQVLRLFLPDAPANVPVASRKNQAPTAPRSILLFSNKDLHGFCAWL